MNHPRLGLSFLLFLSAAMGACNAGSGGEPSASSKEALGIVPPGSIGTIGNINVAASDQSFTTPTPWSTGFASSSGWDPSKHVRVLADIDHDGKQDIVGFGDAGVYVARSLGTSFESARFVLAQFGDGPGMAWNNTDDIRTVADINGDARPDIVGFGTAGVWTALGDGTGFGAAHYVLADFGYNQGWRVSTHVRTLADINGDGRADIVAYGDGGVYVALASGDGGFGPSSYMIANFGANQGWNNTQHVRTTGDIDGDGRADLVAFGYDGVWTALSNSSGSSPSFAAPHYVLAQFGASSAAGSWTAGGRHERRVVDIDGDHKADIVGFGENGTYAARATGDGGFGPQTLAVADYGFQQMGYALLGESQRYVGDFNGDGLVDVVAYKNSDAIRRSLGTGGGNFAAPVKVMSIVGNIGGQIDAGDVDGDGKPDLVGYTDKNVMVERSTASAPPPPPAAPSNVHVISVSDQSMYVGWTDNSSDEVAFLINYVDTAANVSTHKTAPANAISNNLTGLLPSTRYCVTIASIGWFGTSTSPQACGTTLLGGPTVGETAHTHTSLGFSIQGLPAASQLRWHLDTGATTTVAGKTASPGFTDLTPGSYHCLHAQQLVGSTWSVETVQCATTDSIQTGTTRMALKSNVPYEGYVVYNGAWPAGSGTITSFTSADNLPAIGLAFIKRSAYTGGDLNPLCGDPNALIYLGGGGTLSASEVSQVSFQGPSGELDFYACGVNRDVATYLYTNVNWQK